jgi:uncharacterized phage protein (predicted DNA packaging)
MQAPTLQELKAQIRSNTNDEDALLSSYLAAAILFFQSLTNKTLVETAPTSETELQYDALIKQAILLLAADWCINRETTSESNRYPVSVGFINIVNRYRVWISEEGV